jgi:hypothetical protein
MTRDPQRATVRSAAQAGGVIAHYREIGRTTQKRQGWAREWLDQQLDVRPDEEGKAAVAEIAERARRVTSVSGPGIARCASMWM